MSKDLGTIAVDLTPLLPGGENGGAKIFVLELLQRLAEMAPATQFVLLTQAASHDELACLDRPNLRRLMIVGPAAAATSKRRRFRHVAARFMGRMPGRLRGAMGSLGYRLGTALKRRDAGTRLRDLGVELLFCPFTAPTYFEMGIPTVCTIHDLQYKTYPEFFTPADVSHRDRVFIDACRKATAIAAVSDYSRDVALRYGSVRSDAIRAVHHRIARRISPQVGSAQDVIGKLSLAPGKYFLYPANFWKHKNHEMLLTAFGMACRQGLPDDIKLVCTGAPGARQQWLQTAARTIELSERILFPGFLPNDGLAALMAGSLGVVFPSLYEGFGLPIVEAMAAGVPVACSNATSLPEVAADAAILFDPRVPQEIAQALVALASDGELRARLIRAGLDRADEFSDTARMAREYWDLFEYAVSNEKQEHLLTGAYVDGWSGPLLNIQVAPANAAQTLEIELTAPEWLPHPKVTAKVRLGGKALGSALELTRGSGGLISLPVSPAGGHYEVRISPSFVPAQFGFGDDQRELAAMLKTCVIVDHQANRIEVRQ